MRSLLLTFVCLGAVLAAAGCGSKGATGAPGQPGPTGTQGPSGSTNPPPHIDSIGPSQGGASGSTWFIKGSGFSSTPNKNQVFFNGNLATVTTATSNQLTVTHAFPASQGNDGIMVVTVEVANQLSNEVPTAIYPDGTFLPQDLPIWHQADHIALNATGIFVFDGSTGSVFEENRTTHAITRLASSNQNGLATITNVFVDSVGDVYVADQTPAGAGRVLILDSVTGNFGLYAEMVSPLQGMTADADNNLYFVSGFAVTKWNGGVQQQSFGNAGSVVLSSNGNFAVSVGSVVAQGGLVYVAGAYSAHNTIFTVNTTTGAQGSLPSPVSNTMSAAIVGDGTSLYVLDNSGGVGEGEISKINETTGVTTQFTDLPMTDGTDGAPLDYSNFTGMAIDADDKLYLVGGTLITQLPNARIIRLDDAATAHLEATGLSRPSSALFDPSGDLLIGDTGNCLSAGGAVEGPVISFNTDGTVTPVTYLACTVGGLAFNGGTLALADALTDVLESIDPDTGAIATIADLTTALSSTGTGGPHLGLAVDPASGNYYVFGEAGTQNAPLQTGSIAKVTAAGVVTANFATSPGPLSAGTVAEGNLVGFGFVDGTFESAPLATGGATALFATGLPNIFVLPNGMAPDGNSGFYAADVGGAIYDMEAGGIALPVTSVGAQVSSFTIDPFGDFLVVGVSSGSNQSVVGFSLP